MTNGGASSREPPRELSLGGSPTPIPAGSKQNTSMSLLANLDALMSPEKVQTANELRRQMWTGGLTGLVGSLAAALISFQVAKRVPSLQRYTNKNYAFAAALCAGSVGSFLGTVVNGKNAIQMSVVSHAPVVTPHDESFLRRQESIVAATNSSKSPSGGNSSSKKSF